MDGIDGDEKKREEKMGDAKTNFPELYPQISCPTKNPAAASLRVGWF
jgi:hypothetical protein